MSDRLYLDHAATTPVLAAAREAMVRGVTLWANPSSPHASGRAARAALEDARQRVRSALGWDGEVIFTSGATEAIALALGSAHSDALLVSASEHEAVLRHSEHAILLPVTPDGCVSTHVLEGRLGACGASAPLVAIQSANNETGVLQPHNDLARVVASAGGLLFADCSQTAGKLPLPAADLIAISGHKFGGMPGTGALLVRDLTTLRAGGGQERGYRAGTENLPGAMAMAVALEGSNAWLSRARDLRAHLDGAIEAAGGAIVGKGAPKVATICGYRMPGVASAAQLIQFDLAGIAVSAGSACSSGSMKSSHVLAAMGWDERAAGEVIRVSFGPETTRADIYRFVEAWRRIANAAKQRAA